MVYVDGDYGGGAGQIPSVASQFVKEVEDPSTEGDIKKSRELKWETKRGGGGRYFNSSRRYGRVCDDYQHLNRIYSHSFPRWLYHR